MGTFSSADEWMQYEEGFCIKCAHFKDGEDGEGCPVMVLHHLWDMPKATPEQQSILDSFIPQNPDKTGNDKCNMFALNIWAKPVEDTRADLQDKTPYRQVKMV